MLGELPGGGNETLDLVVLSPGVPVDLPLVEELRAEGSRPSGERWSWPTSMERARCAGHHRNQRKDYYHNPAGGDHEALSGGVFVVGNIGTPTPRRPGDDGTVIAVAEISSFQLETIEEFHPQGQRHPEYYAGSSESPSHHGRLYWGEGEDRQEPDRRGSVVLNYEDERDREFGTQVKAQVLYFSSRHKLERASIWTRGPLSIRTGGSEALRRGGAAAPGNPQL